MRFIKGKSITLTEAEYNKFEKVNGDYVLDLVASSDCLSESENKRLFDMLCDGKSKSVILAEFGLSEFAFGQICKKYHGSQKITEIRDKLRIQKALATR